MKTSHPELNICKEETYRKLYFQWAQKIQNFIYYKCGDRAMSEDLCQESFLRAWNNCSKILPEKASAFLYRVANNLFLDKVKHEKVVLNFKQRVTKSVEFEDPAYQLEMKEFKEQLENILAEMPEKDRIVFMMSRYDKLKYREIAEKLELSVKAIEKRMQSALKYLKKMKIKL